MPVANLFGSNPHIEVIVSGGVIYPRLGVLVGPLAVDAISKLHADVAIMGGGGITLEGITNSHALLIDIQQAMIRAASKVIFCLDHTKFGRRSVAHLCDLSSIDVVVTDSAAPLELVQARCVPKDSKSSSPHARKVHPPELSPPAPIRKQRTATITKRVPTRPRPEKRLRPPEIIESSDSRMGWD